MKNYDTILSLSLIVKNCNRLKIRQIKNLLYPCQISSNLKLFTPQIVKFGFSVMSTVRCSIWYTVYKTAPEVFSEGDGKDAVKDQHSPFLIFCSPHLHLLQKLQHCLISWCSLCNYGYAWPPLGCLLLASPVSLFTDASPLMALVYNCPPFCCAFPQLTLFSHHLHLSEPSCPY